MVGRVTVVIEVVGKDLEQEIKYQLAGIDLYPAE